MVGGVTRDKVQGQMDGEGVKRIKANVYPKPCLFLLPLQFLKSPQCPPAFESKMPAQSLHLQVTTMPACLAMFQRTPDVGLAGGSFAGKFTIWYSTAGVDHCNCAVLSSAVQVATCNTTVEPCHQQIETFFPFRCWQPSLLYSTFDHLNETILSPASGLQRHN